MYFESALVFSAAGVGAGAATGAGATGATGNGAAAIQFVFE